jgi:hypothetical protein
VSVDLFSPLLNGWDNGTICTNGPYSAYSPQQSTYYASGAFTQSLSTDGAGIGSLPGQLEVWGWTDPQPLFGYAFSSPLTGGGTSGIVSWTIEGSNDLGVTWTVVDSQSGETAFTVNAVINQIFYYPRNTTPYARYRANISANGGNGSLTQVGQLILFASGVQIQVYCQSGGNPAPGGGTASVFPLQAISPGSGSVPVAFGTFSLPDNFPSIISAQFSCQIACQNLTGTIGGHSGTTEGECQAAAAVGSPPNQMYYSLGAFRAAIGVDVVDLIAASTPAYSSTNPALQILQCSLSYPAGNFPSDWYLDWPSLTIGVAFDPTSSASPVTTDGSTTITNACWTLVLNFAADCPNPCFSVGVFYSGGFQIAGGTAPYQVEILDGEPPPGLSLDASTGDISGVPTMAGSYGMLLQITDSSVPPNELTLCCCMVGGNPCAGGGGGSGASANAGFTG